VGGGRAPHRVLIDADGSCSVAEILRKSLDEQVGLLVHQRHHRHHALPREGLDQDAMRDGPPAVIVVRHEQAVAEEVVQPLRAGQRVGDLGESLRHKLAAVGEGVGGVNLFDRVGPVHKDELDESKLAQHEVAPIAKAEAREAIVDVVPAEAEGRGHLTDERKPQRRGQRDRPLAFGCLLATADAATNRQPREDEAQRRAEEPSSEEAWLWLGRRRRRAGEKGKQPREQLLRRRRRGRRDPWVPNHHRRRLPLKFSR